ncbi:MAG: hypothetical protein UR12_C0037G0002 [candidate division TM6 bacterium GW2011_GWF2_30_66]|nr:MAG: hypothetical protein UR12_C0037G0002 [candidate division TM6 bacterium GW2011_GWF2_30_66]
MIKRFYYSILFSIFLLNLNLQAVVIETSSLDDVFKYADKNSIVVLDIDSTLVEVEHGVEYWVEHKQEKLEKMGLQPEQACDLVLYTFFIISRVAKLFPINDSPKVVNKLQKMGIRTMALTNRSLPIVKRTIKLLKDIGIDFSKNALFKNDLVLNISHKGMFYKGVIFSGKNDKGSMLKEFFKKINYTPKKLIFVDDKVKHVKSVEKKFDDGNVEYIGIRYSFMDEKKKNFDPIEAENGIRTFKIALGLEPIYSKPIAENNSLDKNINKKIETGDNWAISLWNKITCPFKKAYKAYF